MQWKNELEKSLPLSIFLDSRSISNVKEGKLHIVKELREILPIPICFRNRSEIQGWIVQIEEEKVGDALRPLLSGKKRVKTKLKDSTLTFLFVYQNQVYPHPTALTTDMLHDYILLLSKSKKTKDLCSLLKFEVAFTGARPVSRGYKDLFLLFPSPSGVQLTIPFCHIFSEEVLTFKEVPVGLLTKIRSFDRSTFPPIPQTPLLPLASGKIDNPDILSQERLDATFQGLENLERKKRLEAIFSAAPVKRHIKKAGEEKSKTFLDSLDVILKRFGEPLGPTSYPSFLKGEMDLPPLLIPKETKKRKESERRAFSDDCSLAKRRCDPLFVAKLKDNLYVIKPKEHL